MAAPPTPRRDGPLANVTRLRRPVRQSLAALAISLMLLSTAAGDEDLVSLEEQVMRTAVTDIAASVVRIETIGGQERVGRMLVGAGPTTGVVVSADGYIISSSFNFVQKPASILVTLPNGRRVPATVASRDRSCKLVLLKVETEEPLTVPPVAPRDETLVGQWAIAVGRTFDFEFPNQSVGILSAKNRIWGKAIQTDANVSPSNYGGPLIDLQGRVLGILVPLSPNSNSELAGAEWYDSGIGFAIPLDDILGRLERMKEGELARGILGITLKGNDIYGAEAELAACQVKSPAHVAGLRAGDVIVACNDIEVRRQSHLKHALGPLYAGDRVRLTVRRADQTLEFEAELTDRLIPFVQPFLGILPGRGVESLDGIQVRHVFPRSGAAKAGVKRGDRVVAAEGEPVPDSDALRARIANLEPGNTIKLRVERESEELEVTATLSALPERIPADLPPVSMGESSEPPAEEAETGEIEVDIPEETNSCFAYVPGDYTPEKSYGVVVHITVPGKLDRQELLTTWGPLCEASDLILLVPQPADESRWAPTEVEFIRKTIDAITNSYRVDEQRIVVHGRQTGGSMAYLVGFRYRDLVRGIVTVDAVVPGMLRLPDADPIQRLAFLMAKSDSAKTAPRIEKAIEVLRQMKHPVTVLELGPQQRKLNEDEHEALVRWIDGLDRI